MKVLLFGLLVLYSFASQAVEFELKLGGWSNHFVKNNNEQKMRELVDPKFSYNENHKGYGIKVFVPFKGQEWKLYAEVWRMTESYGNPYKAYSVGLSKSFVIDSSIVDHIGVNLPVAYVERSTIFWDGIGNAWVDRDKYIRFTPHITLYKNQFGLDLALLPLKTDGGTSLTGFMRLSYVF
jgi:hypothetical protein